MNNWFHFENAWNKIARTLIPGNLFKRMVPAPGEELYTLYDVVDSENLEGSEIVTSMVRVKGIGVEAAKIYNTKHKVAIDIDLPCALVESTTPGNFHLYIDKEISRAQYDKILSALTEAGIVQEGYYRAFEERGFTTLRTPWTKKV